MTDEKHPKNTNLLNCKICDFHCSRPSEYSRHISTAKHTRLTLAYKKPQENTEYKCICGNEYKHRQSLYKHKQTCSEIADANYKNKIIEDLLKKNNPLLKKVEQNVQSIMALSNFY